ncbi:MAG: efflux RND transporter permease subunit [Polyangiales bacterium]
MIDTLVRKRRLFINFLVFCVVLLGTKIYGELPREANPDVSIPVVTVMTPYIGVSPQDIESLVTIPLENELAGVKDLKHLTSTSYEGLSAVILEFEPEVVIQDALQRVRDRVGRVSTLPEDAEDTIVSEISFSDLPILIVTLGGPVDEVVLKRLGEALEEDIQSVAGVLDANLSGGREREIRVEIDPRRLSYYGLSMNDVSQAIATENVNIPGGDVDAGDATFLLRVPGEATSPSELANIAIKRVGDRPVFVRDVARVVDGFAPRATYARMNGETSVSIAVSKSTGANIVEVVDAVQSMVDEHAELWPEGVHARYLGDQSKLVDDMVSELENGIITGLLLVVAVLLFFMGVRNSFFVAIAIPLSMLLAFIVISAFGLTLNMIVLFSLIMALGMLVDNAIVLVENIFRHVEEGKDPITASVIGTQEVAGAVAASTATTVAAFAPLLFWTGMMGQFMGYLPKTIVIVLICSLVVAVLVLPVTTAVFMKRSKRAQAKADAESETTEAGDGPYREGEIDNSPLAETGIMGAYRRFLELAIRRRYITFLLGNVALIGTFMAYGALNHGVEFFPETEPARATVSIRAPIGTDVDTTDRISRQVEAILASTENVDVFVAEVGVAGGGQDPMSASQTAANMARITVDFLPDANTARPGEHVRVEPTTDTIEAIRTAVREIPGAEISVEKERMGPPVGSPIDVRVSGDEVHELGRLAARVRRDLREIEGSTGLTDNYRVGRPEMRLRIDRGAAKRVGSSTQAVAGTVRAAVAGQKASAWRDGEDEYDIMVTVAPEFREDLQAIMALRIDGREDISPDTFPVPLSAVATYELAGGTGAIHHIDQQLVVSVTGDVEEGYQQDVVQQAVLDYIDETELPPGYSLSLGGSNDEQAETGEFLARAMLIALLLILCVLVFQFNAILTPIIVLYSVILSLVGVLWGLVLTGTPFGIMMTGLGVISLAGIVVNNAIVLLDYVGQLRERGATVVDALVRAGMTRFRPVILTAITTVLGLIPMAIGVSLDFRKFKLIVGSTTASWWAPMAIAIIFGLGAATLLTLVLIPSLYAIAEDFRGFTSRTWARLKSGRSDADGPGGAATPAE